MFKNQALGWKLFLIPSSPSTSIQVRKLQTMQEALCSADSFHINDPNKNLHFRFFMIFHYKTLVRRIEPSPQAALVFPEDPELLGCAC